MLNNVLLTSGSTSTASGGYFIGPLVPSTSTFMPNSSNVSYKENEVVVAVSPIPAILWSKSLYPVSGDRLIECMEMRVTDYDITISECEANSLHSPERPKPEDFHDENTVMVYRCFVGRVIVPFFGDNAYPESFRSPVDLRDYDSFLVESPMFTRRTPFGTYVAVAAILSEFESKGMLDLGLLAADIVVSCERRTT